MGRGQSYSNYLASANSNVCWCLRLKMDGNGFITPLLHPFLLLFSKLPNPIDGKRVPNQPSSILVVRPTRISYRVAIDNVRGRENSKFG